MLDAASVTHSSAERLTRNSIQLMLVNPDRWPGAAHKWHRLAQDGTGCIPEGHAQFVAGD